MSPLEAPLVLPNGVVLPNRIAKAATEEALGDAGSDPTPELTHLYGRWARGGAGLLLTGHVIVDRAHRGRARDIVLEDDAALDRLRAWAAAGRVNGNAMWMQLNHAGRQTPRMIAKRPLAPSAVDAVRLFGNFGRPRAMSAWDISEVVSRFARAATIAMRAGFNGVQIHAAHGYLLSQFLSPLTNRRTDAYGGVIANRARLLLDVVRAVRSAVGTEIAVSVKINSADFQRGGFDGDDFREVARMLDAEKIDLLEISGGCYESFAFFGDTGDTSKQERTRAREAYFLEFARDIRHLVTVPLMLTGGFRSRAAMEEALHDGIDVIGLARPLIVEPELPNRLLRDPDARARDLPARRAPARLSALAEGAWYWSELVRVARGGEPNLASSTWRAILRYVGYDLVTSLFASRERPALVAGRAPMTLGE